METIRVALKRKQEMSGVRLWSNMTVMKPQPTGTFSKRPSKPFMDLSVNVGGIVGNS
jgi:hypothetical protein